MKVSKPRGINADIQSPRTKLLYFIYSAPNSRIKAEPGVKSSISSALGYKSDGHFHYDWNYLLTAGMIEEKQGYYVVTDDGKKEFALHSTASRSNSIMILIGIAIIVFTFGLELKTCSNNKCDILRDSADHNRVFIFNHKPKKQTETTA